MYTKKELENALVIDIETAAAEKDFDTLKEKNPHLAEIWLDKFHPKFLKQENEKESGGTYTNYASLVPEFGKVICISVGLFLEDEKIKNSLQIDITNISNHNESDLLKEFKDFLDKLTSYNLAGFNIKGFDIPFLCKRFLINGIDLPELLKIKGKKPWEMKFIDVMDDWKFGSTSNISLDLLSTTLGIPTPKDGIKNYEVSMLYHKDNSNLDKISNYCGKDVKATMLVMSKLAKIKIEKLTPVA